MLRINYKKILVCYYWKFVWKYSVYDIKFFIYKYFKYWIIEMEDELFFFLFVLYFGEISVINLMIKELEVVLNLKEMFFILVLINFFKGRFI